MLCRPVLGGKILIGDVITDVNSIPSGRTAYIHGETHAPDNGYWLIQSIYNSEDGAQIAYSLDYSIVMTRKKMNNVWTDWYRMDNYGTKNLSELASLLGDYYPVKKFMNSTVTASSWQTYKVGAVAIVYVYWGMGSADATYNNESILFKCNNSIKVLKNANIYDFEADGETLKVKAKTAGAYGTYVLNLT